MKSVLGKMLKKPNTLNKTSTANKAVDGLGRSMRDYTFDRVENRFVHNDDLVHVSSYDMKPKVGSPEHRKKNPQLYGYHYTSKIDQAIYPPGEAPSEKKDHSKHFVKTPKTEVKVAMPVIDHSLLRNSVADKAKAAALEQVRVFAFTPRLNPDANKGIGFLMKTIAAKKPEEEV